MLLFAQNSVPFFGLVNALALPEAINWMADLGYNRAIIESDCKWIIEGIKGDGIEHTNLGVIICFSRHVLV